MSSFIKYLQNYNNNVQPVLDEIFDSEKMKMDKLSTLAGDMVLEYKKFMSGGKRLRGCQILLGYGMFGGKNKEEGLRGSTIIEIMHSFLLMHDDVIDNDDMRRGEPTMHKKLAQSFGEEYGKSMAVILGDEGCFLAYRILNSLDLPKERLSGATEYLSQVLIEVGLGEAMDITFEKQRRFTEEDVLQVHRFKTAEYTVGGPIILGAMLAGFDSSKMQDIKNFGFPVGIAFQLRDDELGMFANEEVIGKPADSDLKEGKVTLLIVKALENANPEEKKFLEYAHGNKDLTKDEVEKVRDIMRSGGALAYSQKRSRELVEEGKKFIPEITKDANYQQLLSELADFVIERNS